MIATPEHLAYCQTISDCIAEAARNSNSGLALRTPDYIAEKISAGNAVIALDGDVFAGFCTFARR